MPRELKFLAWGHTVNDYQKQTEPQVSFLQFSAVSTVPRQRPIDAHLEMGVWTNC